MTDVLKFTCPKCAHDRAMPAGHGLMRCNSCKFTAVPASFRLEKRPSLKWDEAAERYSDDQFA
jgi:ribosomal protein L37AE/L43A